jgi:hypothetical protein
LGRHSEGKVKKLILGFAVLPFIGGGGSAADLLTNDQMDRVTAGLTLSIDCPTCIVANSTSVSNNGVTVNMSSVVTPPPPPPPDGGSQDGGSQGGGQPSGPVQIGGSSPGGSQGGGSNPGALGGANAANILQLAGFNPLSP